MQNIEIFQPPTQVEISTGEASLVFCSCLKNFCCCCLPPPPPTLKQGEASSFVAGVAEVGVLAAWAVVLNLEKDFPSQQQSGNSPIYPLKLSLSLSLSLSLTHTLSLSHTYTYSPSPSP